MDPAWIELSANPVIFNEGEEAVQVNNVPETSELKTMFVFELLQIRLYNGLLFRSGSESIMMVLVMESLHPSVE